MTEHSVLDYQNVNDVIDKVGEIQRKALTSKEKLLWDIRTYLYVSGIFILYISTKFIEKAIIKHNLIFISTSYPQKMPSGFWLFPAW